AKVRYESLSEGNEKDKALSEYKVVRKQARDLFTDIVQLIGGFYVLDDLQPISDILVKEYKESVDVRKLKDKINKEKVDLSAKESKLKEKGKSKAEIKNETKADRDAILEQEKKLEVEEKQLEEVRAEIYKLMEKHGSHPEFDKYEKYRDKGINLTRLNTEEMRRLRKDLQLIFQDPYSSLNPRMTVGQIISEGLLAHNMFDKNDEKLQDYVVDVMKRCGLDGYFLHRYPHQFSGGQRQRIGIARSVALDPKFIVCDEAVSALDVSIQSQIINLLLDLKEQHNLTYLFISHDLSVIKYISDRVGVMYLGNIVELAETKDLYDKPMHPYTEALLSAIPTTDIEDKREVVLLEGDIPSPIDPPSGCKFHTRCKYATDICKTVVPEFEEASPGHFVACHHKLNQD
ncbi:MAG: ATP-binding cassette domain-containing protein, partial [Clostridiales bacterium]|nr:ATP-binding cassette domain-containing protein [Clostridiales bacterium]